MFLLLTHIFIIISHHTADAESQQTLMLREVKVFRVRVNRRVHHLVWEES